MNPYKPPTLTRKEAHEISGWVRAKPSRWEPETTGPDFFRGCIYGLLLCAPFWLTLIGIVWLANTLIGGG